MLTEGWTIRSGVGDDAQSRSMDDIDKLINGFLVESAQRFATGARMVGLQYGLDTRYLLRQG